MLAALADARASVRFENYIYKPGDPGDRFRAALVAAAVRGVKVRVLLDGFGSRDLPLDYWRALETAGGEAGVFNPLALDRLVIRDHRNCSWSTTTGLYRRFQHRAGVCRRRRDARLARLRARALRPLARCLAASFDAMWAYREFGIRGAFVCASHGCGAG